MKPATLVLATLSVMLFFEACSSAPSTPVIDDVQKVAEGGSSQDTLNIKADDSESAFVFESFSAEGGSSRDTIYLKPKTRAKFYKIKDYKRKKKP